MGKAATEGKQRLAWVAVELVLFDGILNILTHKRVLELSLIHI